MNKRNLLFGCSLTLFLSACSNSTPTGSEPLPTSQKQSDNNTTPLATNASGIIPDVEKVHNTLITQSTAVAAIEIFPKNIIVTSGQPTRFYVKAYDIQGKDLGIIQPDLLNIKIEDRGTNPSISSDDQAFNINPNTDIGLLTFQASLKVNPEVKAAGSLEIVSLQPDVKKFDDTQVLFPKSNIDYDSLTNQEILDSIQPFTKEEFSNALLAIDSESIPSFPMILGQKTTISVNDKIFFGERSILYGKITRIIQQKNDFKLVMVTPISLNDMFSEYSSTPLLPESYSESFSFNSSDVPSSGKLSAQSSLGGWECTGAIPEAINVTGGSNVTFTSNEIYLEPHVNMNISLAPLTTAGLYGFCTKQGGSFKKIALPGAMAPFLHISPDWRGQVNFTTKGGAVAAALEVGGNNKITFWPAANATPWKTDFNITTLTKGDINDVSGPKASFDGKVEGGPVLAFKFQPGPPIYQQEWITRFRGKDYKFDAATLGELSIMAGLKGEASIHSMRTVHENHKTQKIQVGGIIKGTALFGPWIRETFGHWPVFNAIGTIEHEIPVIDSKMPVAEEIVIAKDNYGTADISATWESGEVQGLQLASYQGDKNSLHGDKTSSTGGTVTYDIEDCNDRNNSLSAKVLATGYPKLGDITLPISLPFSTDKRIKVCNRITGAKTSSKYLPDESQGEIKVVAPVGSSGVIELDVSNLSPNVEPNADLIYRATFGTYSDYGDLRPLKSDEITLAPKESKKHYIPFECGDQNNLSKGYFSVEGNHNKAYPRVGREVVLWCYEESHTTVAVADGWKTSTKSSRCGNSDITYISREHTARAMYFAIGEKHLWVEEPIFSYTGSCGEPIESINAKNREAFVEWVEAQKPAMKSYFLENFDPTVWTNSDFGEFSDEYSDWTNYEMKVQILPSEDWKWIY